MAAFDRITVKLDEEHSGYLEKYVARLAKREPNVSNVDAVQRLLYAGWSRHLAGKKYAKSDKGLASAEKARRKQARERKQEAAPRKKAAPKKAKGATPANGTPRPNPGSGAQAMPATV